MNSYFQMAISTIIFGIIFSNIKCLSSTTFGMDSRLAQYSGVEPRSYPGVESRPGVKMEPRPGVRIEPRYPSYTAQTTNLVQVKVYKNVSFLIFFLGGGNGLYESLPLRIGQ